MSIEKSTLTLKDYTNDIFHAMHYILNLFKHCEIASMTLMIRAFSMESWL